MCLYLFTMKHLFSQMSKQTESGMRAATVRRTVLYVCKFAIIVNFHIFY